MYMYKALKMKQHVDKAKWFNIQLNHEIIGSVQATKVIMKQG